MNRRISKTLVASCMAWLSCPALASAQAVEEGAPLPPPSEAVVVGDSLSMDRAVEEAMASSPTLRASVLTARRADRLVTEQESMFQFQLQLDGTASAGNTPTFAVTRDATTGAITGHSIVYPYTESIDLGAQLSRALPWGMTVTGRIDGLRTLRTAAQQTGSSTLVQIGPGYGFNATLSVTQSLLRGFGETVNLAPLYQARADREASDATRDRTASALLRDVLLAYWELWYAERAVAIQTSARDVLARQRDEGRRRTELGALAGADVLTLDSQLASAEASIASAELLRTQAAIELARLLGRRSGASLPVTEATPPRLASALEGGSIEHAIDDAPEVLEARAAVESARVTATVAGQSLEPVLDVGASLQVLGLGWDDVGQTFSTFGSFSAAQLVGTVTYQTPLDDTQLRMERERAALAIEVAEQSLEAARAQALATASSALAADRAASRRLALTEEAVAIGRRALAAQEERRALGAGLLLDVLTAAQTLRQAELDQARAEVDAQEARVRLLHVIGALLARFDERSPE